MIQNFGGGEMLVILILALVVLGPERIPEMARSLGKMMAKAKTMTSGIQGQVQGVMDDPAMQPLKELGDFAARPRQKLAEYALEAEADERAKAEQASIDASDPGTDASSAEPTATAATAPAAAEPATTEPAAAEHTVATPAEVVSSDPTTTDDSQAPTAPSTPAPAPDEERESA